MKKLLTLACIIGVFGIGYLLGTGNTTNIPAERSARDLGLSVRVRTALALNKHLDGAEITVSVAGNEVELRGQVPTAAARQLAEDIARDVGGATRIQNRLTVVPLPPGESPASGDRSLGERLDDLTATARLRTALALHRDIAKGDVSVSVLRGVATLEGTVPSWAARELAAKITEDVEGVRRVLNSIQVEGGEPRLAPPPAPAEPGAPAQQRAADDHIRQQVEAALQVHPYIEARRVRVVVADGVVTLSGIVRSDADRQLIQKIAEDGWGVTGVVNSLEVEPEPAEPLQYAPPAKAERRSAFGDG